jgi:hypothetical protein
VETSDLCYYIKIGINDCAKESCSKKTAIGITVVGVAILALSVLALASIGAQKGWWNARSIEHIFKNHASTTLGLSLTFGLGALFCGTLSLNAHSKENKLRDEYDPYKGFTYRNKPERETPLKNGSVLKDGNKVLRDNNKNAYVVDDHHKMPGIVLSGIHHPLGIEGPIINAIFENPDILFLATPNSIYLYEVSTDSPKLLGQFSGLSRSKPGEFPGEVPLNATSASQYQTRILGTEGVALWRLNSENLEIYSSQEEAQKLYSFSKNIQDVQYKEGTLVILLAGNQFLKYNKNEDSFKEASLPYKPNNPVLIKTSQDQQVQVPHQGRAHFFHYSGSDYVLHRETINIYNAPFELAPDGSGEYTYSAISLMNITKKQVVKIKTSGNPYVDLSKGEIEVVNSLKNTVEYYSIESLFERGKGAFSTDQIYTVVPIKEIN